MGVIEAIDQAILRDHPPEEPRSYIGGSSAGKACSRELWQSFRWAVQIEFGARMHRLFQRGHNEEASFVKYLRDAGITIVEFDGKGEQFAVKFAYGHGGGHLDGAMNNVPGHPGWHVAEFKTASSTSFVGTEKKGCKVDKPVHWAQMQIYMHLTGMPQASYLVVNKNNDALFYEHISYDAEAAERLIAKAEYIVTSDGPPEKISNEPSAKACKYCDFKELCHYDATPQTNCRTCAFSTSEVDGDGRWSCQKHKRDISTQEQRQACDDHRFIPDLLGNWAEKSGRVQDGNVPYKNLRTGAEFINGDGGYSSREISAVQDIKFIGSAETDALKEKMNARVIG